jgi:hypothetical protein
MKIKGPTNGAPPVDAISPSDPLEEVGEVGDAQAVGQVNGTASAHSAGGADSISRVAGQLRAGQITVDQAVGLLIEDAIERQLGSVAQGTGSKHARELEPKLRELLRSYAETDPFLAARIRRLTHGK